MVADPDILVELDHVGFQSGDDWLVQDVSFSVARGEIVTLIGLNGSGKSTTTKLALGIMEPSAGRVIMKPGTRVGYVPQKLVVDWTLPLTVGGLMALTGPCSKQGAETALQRTGVEHLFQAPVQNLSGGEFQRVLLARAIVRNPDLLVLDEPVQGVDFSGEIALYDLISEIRETLDCGILLVSHDLHLVMAATDRVVCLNGHICCQGPPVAVAESEAYRKLFGERAVETLAVYGHHHDHEHLADGSIRYKEGRLAGHSPADQPAQKMNVKYTKSTECTDRTERGT